MARETWVFINSFAGWVEALGTIGAVIVSLYLSTRDRRQSLRVTCTRSVVLAPGAAWAQGTECVWAEVTNSGRRQVTVTHLYWRLPFRKWSGLWLPPRDEWSSELPVTLTDGQSARWLITGEQFANATCPAFAPLSTGALWRFRLRSLRLCVMPSTGSTASGRPDRAVRVLIADAAKRLAADPAQVRPSDDGARDG